MARHVCLGLTVNRRVRRSPSTRLVGEPWSRWCTANQDDRDRLPENINNSPAISLTPLRFEHEHCQAHLDTKREVASNHGPASTGVSGASPCRRGGTDIGLLRMVGQGTGT